MRTYVATTCTACEAPIGFWASTPERRRFEVCRACRAWECEYGCPQCEAVDIGYKATAIHAHLDPCEHGVQDHHCILPDPNQPWPPHD